jgi:hypothetical protein
MDEHGGESHSEILHGDETNVQHTLQDPYISHTQGEHNMQGYVL